MTTSGRDDPAARQTPAPKAGGDAPQPAPQPEVEDKANQAVPEIGGRKGPDPTRFGDWEQNGRCIDF